MRMPLAQIIEHRYPGAIEARHVVIQDDGDGPYIAYWNGPALGPQPTLDQFRSWWLPYEKHARRFRFRHLCDTEYEQLLAPEGNLTLVQRDEILEKRAILGAGGNPPMNAAEKAASDKIALLRQKRRDRWQAVGDVVQQPEETLEQAVERVRVLSW
jgi:hypothetical protein